jgi:small basic protein
MILNPNQFPVPKEQQQRHKHALSMIWAAALAWGITLMWTLYASFVSTDYLGVVVMSLVCAVMGAVVAFAFRWYTKNSFFFYDVLGVRIVFYDSEFYVPSHLMEKLVKCVLDSWQHIIDNPHDVYNKISLHVVKDRPRDPAGRLEQIVGLTFHDNRHSIIWGPYALHPDGAGYELLLHGAESVLPGSSEAAKLQYMREHNVLEMLQESYEIEFS